MVVPAVAVAVTVPVAHLHGVVPPAIWAMGAVVAVVLALGVAARPKIAPEMPPYYEALFQERKRITY